MVEVCLHHTDPWQGTGAGVLAGISVSSQDTLRHALEAGCWYPMSLPGQAGRKDQLLFFLLALEYGPTHSYKEKTLSPLLTS